MLQATAVIQARMSSTRLPGKALMTVDGLPLLRIQIERLKRSDRIERVVVATTTDPVDDGIVETVSAQGVSVCRGDEDDVLNRYYQCAHALKATVVMRLTGDCPLVDPAVCDAVVALFEEKEADYASTAPSFAEGLDCEVFRFEALAEAWRNARLASEREHVTLYIRSHAERFKIVALENHADESAFRLTVDEPQDFTVVASILRALTPTHGLHFPYAKAIAYLKNHPEIMAVNAHIVRNEGLLKSLSQDRVVELPAAGDG